MEALGIDTKLLIAQVVNFALLFLIFKHFISKPFFKWLEKEKETDAERQRILTDLEEKEKALAVKEKEIVAASQNEATKIIQDAKKTALVTREEMIKKAQDEVDIIKKKAQKQLDDEKKKLYIEVKKHLAETSAAVTKTVISEFVDEEKQQEIMRRVVKMIPKEALYEN